jgi:Skp family chaperone for outer membrane proteins
MPTKTILVVAGLLAGALLASSTPGVAQPAAKPRDGHIGVVRIADAMNRFTQSADLEAVFREAALQIDAENGKRQEVLSQRAAELARFNAGTPERHTRERELVRLQAEFEIHARLSAAELDRQQRLWLGRTYQRVSSAAADLARDRDLDAVFVIRPPEFDAPDVNALKQQIVLREVLYARDALDLTDAVLGRLNADYAARGGRKNLQSSMEPLTGP